MSDKNKDKDNKSNLPKLKFSSYWIYGAVLIAIIAMQFFSSGDLASKSISKNKFDEILRDNDIEKIVVLNKDNKVIRIDFTNYFGNKKQESF